MESPERKQIRPRPKLEGAFHHGNLRAALVAAAARMVRKHGHSSVSLRPLARRLKVSQPAIYRHFASKEALLAEVSQRAQADFITVLDAAATACEDRYDALRASGRAYVRWAYANPNEFRLWSSRMVNDARRERLAMPPREHFYQRMAGTVPLDDPALADAFRATWAFCHGLAVLVVERVFQAVDSDEERLAAADAAIDVYVSMVRARWA